ncbi:MAG: alpha-ketoacid dehydrogenase subunit beta [Gammaproteobacteria bacterium]|nr:alpha-ketoacid dehydrogenase subunit beta [Gammaproteobacteria bacterium]MBI5616050.1 alpha-ketoacid dehydrogenase subunit beta [Gammaproteobacteria bacterium]
METIRFGQAIGKALGDAMRADPRVFLLGEDIGAAGGPFGVTRGLHKEFGAARVRDFPISEAALVGTALGAALCGWKPVAEIMFMDFCTLAMDNLVNQAAKAHFMFGGQSAVPLVVRTPHGGGLNAGAQHSQCLEAWFAHVPGLTVLCPATPADAYGLLRSAIASPNPVVFVENKSLYARKGGIEADPQPIPIGEARLVREGTDVTVVTYGASVYAAEAAVRKAAEEGIDLEIVDLRSLQPWDEKTVLASLAKTHRLVIFHEAVEAFGIGAEIAARMADVGFDELDAPIVRVGAPFMPVPYSPALEREYLPNEDKLMAAVRRVLL